MNKRGHLVEQLPCNVTRGRRTINIEPKSAFAAPNVLSKILNMFGEIWEHLTIKML